MIPGIFHFIFGMSPDFGGKPFSLVHYLAIRSAIDVNQPKTVFFHYQYEPKGEWWEKIKPFLTLNQIEAPQSIFGNRLYHVAHQSDVVRLQMLQKHGGIYLDLDTICVKPLSPFLDASFVIGQQFKPKYVFYDHHLLRLLTGLRRMNAEAFRGAKVEGLCNAVMLSEPNSEFVNRWLNSYHSFRSKGRDQYWGEHSVFLPQRLADENPGLLTIAGPYAFHYPVYNRLGMTYLFKKKRYFSKAYVHHLWESHSWDKYLRHLTPEKIKREDTTYNLLARRFLD
jgi:hypothetical protein